MVYGNLAISDKKNKKTLKLKIFFKKAVFSKNLTNLKPFVHL
jgi:hypothetical protein